MKRHSYLFAAFSVGKWTQSTCMEMLRKLADVTRRPSWQDMLTVFTDGNDDYSYVLPRCFPLGLVDYGQLVKIKEGDVWWARKGGRSMGRRLLVK